MSQTPKQEGLPVAIIEALFDDLLRLQTVLRAEQQTLVIDRQSYASQVANRMRSNYFAASKVMQPHWPALAQLRNEPIEFFGVAASSYARLIFDLALRSIKVAESLRQGFSETQHGVVSLSGFYAFTRTQTTKLRQRFDAEEPFRFTGTSANQIRKVHQRLGLLLVGFRQESPKWARAVCETSSTTKSDGPVGRRLPTNTVRRLNVKKVQGSERRFRVCGQPVTASAKGARILDAVVSLQADGETINPKNVMLKVGYKLTKDERRTFECDKGRLNKVLIAEVEKGLYVKDDGEFRIQKPPMARNKKTARRR